jgi:F-type H+-transporting ATPase subunit gamma
MANLEELRQRIDSAQDMQAIVRVMKTLSAVSITQYQNAARRLRAYQEVVDRSLHAAMMDRRIAIEDEPDPAQPTGLIVFGSDRGLCGRFNEIVVDHACRWLEGRTARVPILAIGERGAARLEAQNHPADNTFTQPGSVAGLSQNAEAILLEVDTWRAEKDIERVMAVFNVEAGRGRVEPHIEMLLPIDSGALHRIVGRAWPSNQIPVLDGPTEQVLSAFIRERLYTSLMRAGAESLAAEHATRLSAMQAAERNISDSVEELQGRFRHERQEAITNELMDIVAAYQSVLEK